MWQMPEASSAYFEFSLIEGGPLARLRRLAGRKLGVRILVLIAIGWLPVVAGALIEGQLFDGSGVADPLLRHFGVHVRLLLAVPLLLFVEVVMDQKLRGIVRNFVDSGLVDDATRPAFAEVLKRAEQLRDSPIGTAFVLLAMASTLWSSTHGLARAEEMAWTGGKLGFAGAWYTLVSRPIFVLLVSVWAWRLMTGWILIWRISKLDLRLVPSHPDRAGGLGFVEGITGPSSIIVFALVSVIAGRWGHEVLYHGTHVQSLQPLAIMLLVISILVFAGPLLLLTRILLRFKRQSVGEYGRLSGRQGRLVHRKWILNESVGDPEILHAPELGPVADTLAIYGQVASIRPVPITKRTLIPIALAVAVPLLPVFAIEIPVKEMLKRLSGALF